MKPATLILVALLCGLMGCAKKPEPPKAISNAYSIYIDPATITRSCDLELVRSSGGKYEQDICFQRTDGKGHVLPMTSDERNFMGKELSRYDSTDPRCPYKDWRYLSTIDGKDVCQDGINSAWEHWFIAPLFKHHQKPEAK